MRDNGVRVLRFAGAHAGSVQRVTERAGKCILRFVIYIQYKRTVPVRNIYANTVPCAFYSTLGGMVMVVVVIVVVVEWSCLGHLALVSVPIPFVGCAFSA